MVIKMMKRKVKQIAEKFRQGIAEAIGVPPEYIREDVVERWVEGWIRAFVKPQFLTEVLGSNPNPYTLGLELGRMINDAIRRRDTGCTVCL